MKMRGKTQIPSFNMLFIGNSFTARNNMPQMLAELAAASGKSLTHTLISVCGASLRMHWNKGVAQQSIESGSFDYVVLQEQSTLPVKNAARMHENIRLFDAVIKGAGAKTVLYMTWAREREPQNQQLISEAYRSIGNELKALVVPVGSVWRQVIEASPSIGLFDKDGSHPSFVGSYLAACVFYSVLFQESTSGIRIPGDTLIGNNIRQLQKAASVKL